MEEIKALLAGKFAAKLGDEKARQRTFNALVRLGYGYSDIREAMRAYETEEIFDEG